MSTWQKEKYKFRASLLHPFLHFPFIALVSLVSNNAHQNTHTLSTGVWFATATQGKQTRVLSLSLHTPSCRNAGNMEAKFRVF